MLTLLGVCYYYHAADWQRGRQAVRVARIRAVSVRGTRLGAPQPRRCVGHAPPRQALLEQVLTLLALLVQKYKYWRSYIGMTRFLWVPSAAKVERRVLTCADVC